MTKRRRAGCCPRLDMPYIIKAVLAIYGFLHEQALFLGDRKAMQ